MGSCGDGDVGSDEGDDGDVCDEKSVQDWPAAVGGGGVVNCDQMGRVVGAKKED